MSLADEYQLLSTQFRNKFATLSEYARLQVEKTMLETFSSASLRYVQLWTRTGVQQRNFIGPRMDPKERKKRILFAEAILNTAQTNRPTKETILLGEPTMDGQKLKEYLESDYIAGTDTVGAALEKIQIDSDGTLIIIYDAYPDELAPVQAYDPNDEEFSDVMVE